LYDNLLRKTERAHNNKDGTEKTDAVEKGIKDKRNERTDEWAGDVRERLTSHSQSN